MASHTLFILLKLVTASHCMTAACQQRSSDCMGIEQVLRYMVCEKPKGILCQHIVHVERYSPARSFYLKMLSAAYSIMCGFNCCMTCTHIISDIGLGIN